MLTLQLEKHSGWGFAANCSFSAKTIARTRNDLTVAKGPQSAKRRAGTEPRQGELLVGPLFRQAMRGETATRQRSRLLIGSAGKPKLQLDLASQFGDRVGTLQPEKQCHEIQSSTQYLTKLCHTRIIIHGRKQAAAARFRRAAIVAEASSPVSSSKLRSGWYLMTILLIGAGVSGVVLGATNRIIFLLPAALMAFVVASVLIVRTDIDLGLTALTATLFCSSYLLGVVMANTQPRLFMRPAGNIKLAEHNDKKEEPRRSSCVGGAAGALYYSVCGDPTLGRLIDSAGKVILQLRRVVPRYGLYMRCAV